MADIFEKSLNIKTTDVTVANTTTETSVYSFLLPGGSLGTTNKAKWEMSGKIGFAAGASLTVRAYYGGALIASCTVASSASGSNKGLAICVKLSGDGSVSAQFGIIESYVGIAYSVDNSVPVGWGQGSIASGGDQTFEIKVQWGAASASSTITHHHSTLLLLGFSPPADPVALPDPSIQILVSSKLNKLRYDLREFVYFYAPLEHTLDFYGYGETTFTRAGSTVATWRDGASHTIEANEPRMEYSGESVLGLGINTSSEALNFTTANSLHDSNTLAWMQNGVYKSTKRGDTNIFNSSGDYIGPSGVHITDIVKYNKQITSAEDVETETALA